MLMMTAYMRYLADITKTNTERPLNNHINFIISGRIKKESRLVIKLIYPLFLLFLDIFTLKSYDFIY